MGRCTSGGGSHHAGRLERIRRVAIRAVSRSRDTATAGGTTIVRRGEITEAAWEQIEPLLPENGRKGGRWRDHRTVIDGIPWKLRTGTPWRDLPERYGPRQTCFDRFNRWRRDSTWDRLLEHAQTKSDVLGEVGWEVSVDDTVGRAHQHVAGGQEARR